MATKPCPSPTPPWHRPTQSPQTETFTQDNDAGTLSLTMDVTYLTSEVLKANPDDPYVAAIPAGNYQRQLKRLYIPGDIQPTTAPWKVTGTFVGFGWLLFNSIGTSAVLEWDGTGWQLVGGNALPQN